MARPRCEKCGEIFNSRRNLKLHRELNACSGSDSNESTPSEPEIDSQKGRKGTSASQRQPVTKGATGTVCMYNDDKGFGFITTADITREFADGTADTEDVFFHISDVSTDWIEEGDRLKFDIVEDDEGLRCEGAEVVKRDRDRDNYDKPADNSSGRLHGFGHNRDETRYGHGKYSPTDKEDKAESFKDERKFR